MCICNLVPRIFVRGSKDPGRGWSRGSQILGAKFQFTLLRGGRGVYWSCLKHCNCVWHSDDKIYICNTQLEVEIASKTTICLYDMTSCEHWVLSNISHGKVDQISVNSLAKESTSHLKHILYNVVHKVCSRPNDRAKDICVELTYRVPKPNGFTLCIHLELMIENQPDSSLCVNIECWAPAAKYSVYPFYFHKSL